MKKSEVKIGSTYRMKHSSGIIDVRITREIDTPQINRSGSYGTVSHRARTHWEAINLKTGRTITIKSAVRLIRDVEAEYAQSSRPAMPATH
jgi:hypothetical protein